MKRKMISLLLGAVLFTSAVWPDQPTLAEQSYGTEQIYDTETPWEAESEKDEKATPENTVDTNVYAKAEAQTESTSSDAEHVYPDIETLPDSVFQAGNMTDGENPEESLNSGKTWNPEESLNSEEARNPEKIWNPEEPWNPEESWNQEEVWDPAEWENPDGIWNEDDSEVGLGFIVLDTENAGEVEAEDPESEALLEEIESGEIIALAAMDPGTPDENTPMMIASAPVYRMEVFDYLDLDEIDRKVTYRELIYTDYQGKERRTPVFCMEAPYKGMDSQVLKNEAIKSLSKSLVQKILYFGYGGPGDICDSFDPSCSHINWSKWDNRYMFTHMALSKHYSGLYGRSPEEQYEHVGVNRFVDKISTLTIPARDGMTFSSNDGYGTQVTAKNLVSNLRIWPKGKAEYAWVDTAMAGFEDGYQISYNIVVRDSAKAGNTISITRTADSPWQLGYWTSKAEMDERGAENPRVLKVGQTVTLKDGYYLRIIFPKQMKTDFTFTCKMSLAPVSFLLIDGEIQTNTSRSQDFGVAVYQGESGVATLKMHPAPSGNLTVTKKDFKDQQPVKGAKYGLYAAEDIYQFSSSTYAAGALLDEQPTDANGVLKFTGIPLGNF
ncbi:MAG: hypothetical protein KBT01_01675, partial [Clostridiales bacterium]|nr:hypothetical protein [Candidatus Blautia equi]